jgi:hypothetical protein
MNESKSNRQYKIKKTYNLIYPYYCIKTGRIIIIIIIIIIIASVERDTVVSIAMGWGLDGPGIESRCGEISCTHSDRSLGLHGLQ